MKLATVERIRDVRNHPNADKLDLVTVLGYQAISGRDQWKVGDLCVFIQPDTVLPNVEWAESYKKKSKRVKAIKLRDEWSFGIVEELSILPQDLMYTEEADVAEILGVTKYDPPMPQDLTAKGALPLGIPKTDEERYQNLDMSKYYGQRVDISLKVDGQSFTAFYADGQEGVTSRGLNYHLDRENHFTKNYHQLELGKKLEFYCKAYGINIALRGEQYGNGIQGLKLNMHATRPLNVLFYSCWDIDNKRYFRPGDQHYYRNVCDALNLPCVPLFEEGVILTPEIIKKYEESETAYGFPFEGVVVTGNGFSFKVINLYYDSNK